MWLTVPNIVSALRVLSVPLFWYVLLGRDDVRLAAILMLVIGATDWVDGYLARRLNQVSEVGKLLDPLADRLMIASALVGGLIAEVVPAVIGWPLFIREVLVALGALYLVRRGGGRLEVRRLGKLATFLVYAAIPCFYLGAAGVTPGLLIALGWVVGVAGIVSYYWVALQYLGDIRRRLAGNVA